MSTTEKPSSVHASKDAPATTSNIPASTVSQLTLRERLSRLKPYFGYQRWTWVLAVLATIVVAGTEADPTTGARAAIYIAPFVEEATKATVLFGVAMLAVALADKGHGPDVLPMVLGGTAVLAAIIFGDSLTWPAVVGIALIIAGVLLVEYGAHRAAERRAT